MKEQLDAIFAQISTMTTAEDTNAIYRDLDAIRGKITGEELDNIRKAMNERIDVIMEADRKFIAETDNMLRLNGIEYDLGEWLTIANYAKKHKVSTNVVSNWIDRGIIPESCVIEMKVLNNIRMIKDRVYK